MRQIIGYLLLMALSTGAYPHVATVSAETDVMQILTCTPRDTPATRSTFEALLKQASSHGPDGPHIFMGVIKAGDACVTNATITAAFGMLVISAEVCGSGYEPILEQIRKDRPHLAKADSAEDPGVIAAYQDGTYGIQFFKGSSASAPAHEASPVSAGVSYTCMYQAAVSP
jgi:hypothetical protein